MIGYSSHRLSVLVLGAIVAVLVGCAAKKKGPEAPMAGEPWVTSVTIGGNKAYSDDEILDGLITAEPSGFFVRQRVRYDTSLVAIDRIRIETFYKHRGYFKVVVAPAEVKKGRGLATAVLFRVVEGPVSVVDTVEIVGVTPTVGSELRLRLDIKDGSRFNYENYDLGKEVILAALTNLGYAHASLKSTATTTLGKNAVVLRYQIVPGPVVYIGDIHVRGLTTIPEFAVRNRLTFASGDKFSTREVNATRDQLRALGRFGVIRIDFADKTIAETSDVVITLREGPRRELRIGAGTAFDGGLSLDNAQWLLRARAGHTVMGIIDPLTTLDVELRPGFAIQTGGSVGRTFVGEASVGLNREDLFLPLLRGDAKLSYNKLAFDNFQTHGPRVGFGLQRPLWRRRVQLGLSYNMELLCFSDRPAIFNPASVLSGEYDAAIAEPLGLDRSCTTLNFPSASSYRLAYLEESIALDMRDSVIETRSGYYLEARFEQAGTPLGGEFGYLRVTPEARAYLPLGPRVVLGGRLRYGRALAGELPITRRYFSGGASSQRGFGQRQLAPVVGDQETSTIEIGGDQLFESSIEARIDLFPILDWLLGLALFVDAADVVLTGEPIDLGDLHIAPGLGLRYHTPIGPLRLDAAYRATRRGAGQIHASNSFAWHLSIGEAF